MATGQLWLFPPPRPLVERFGADFFRALPEAPGVYLLCGEREANATISRTSPRHSYGTAGNDLSLQDF